jgi:hypothetical protein
MGHVSYIVSQIHGCFDQYCVGSYKRLADVNELSLAKAVSWCFRLFDKKCNLIYETVKQPSVLTFKNCSVIVLEKLVLYSDNLVRSYLLRFCS